jgi:hypothetical protein
VVLRTGIDVFPLILVLNLIGVGGGNLFLGRQFHSKRTFGFVEGEGGTRHLSRDLVTPDDKRHVIDFFILLLKLHSDKQSLITCPGNRLPHLG